MTMSRVLAARKKQILADSRTYMRTGISNPSAVVRHASLALKGVKFDTIAVRGTSGLIIGPILAYSLKKHLFVVRKKTEDAHTSRNEGFVGRRWIFVDDFVSTGRTLKEVVRAVYEFSEGHDLPEPECVGGYLYENGTFEHTNTLNLFPMLHGVNISRLGVLA